MANALIAMSGGVDSSVAAYLAMESGLRCIGATMQLHPYGDGVSDARAVADRLGIPFHVLDFTGDFRTQVMDHFVRCYEQGLTPNPCVECNRCLKFDRLLQQAQAMGCAYVVSGHYAQIRYENGRYLLYKAVDTVKDQSYFLYPLTQQQLSHIRFPLGSLTKDDVRRIAQAQGFVNAKKRDSQDICFVPDGDYLAFLKDYTGKTYPGGDFLDTCGNVVGRHCGAVGYTLGQRKGLGIAMGKPVYVCAKDMEKNTVTVGSNDDLMRTTLLSKDWFFFPFDTLDGPLRVEAKTRSRMVQQPATAYPEENGFVRIVFDQPQRAITPGQAVVLYDGDMVIGGGTITQVL